MVPLDYLLDLLIKYKYAFLFPGLVVEGPVLTLMAGILASPAGGSIMNVFTLFWVVYIADITGDTLYYVLGRYGGRPAVKRFGHYVGLTIERFTFVENYFEKHGGKTLALGKISHGFGWPIMAAAGSARMSYGRFILINALVSIPKSIFLVLLGYYYGESFEILSHYIGTGSLIFTTVIIAAVLVYFFVIRRFIGSTKKSE